jgi:pimeloyl-ACP methyl ester carboxylesterase
VLPFESSVLRGNPLGDPHERELAILRPPSGETEGKPLILFLSGFTGSGPVEARRETFLGIGLFRLLHDMMREKVCDEAVIVSPDAGTKLGGSQYVNSTATGKYADYVALEIVPWAKETFRTAHTGVIGQSSGGFGALHLAMEYPRLFESVGSSAGDMAFDVTISREFPRAVRTFQQSGGPERFLRDLYSNPAMLTGPFDPVGNALITLAMSACYSPRADDPGAFDLPFDLDTGELVPDVWKRWLQLDPVHRLREEETQSRLREMRLVHLTASLEDEWYLDLGARVFRHRAEIARVPLLHEEFPGGHFHSAPRYRSLFQRAIDTLSPHDGSDQHARAAFTL